MCQYLPPVPIKLIKSNTVTHSNFIPVGKFGFVENYSDEVSWGSQ